MNKQVLISAQYKLLDAFNYVVTIKAKNEHNEIVFDGSRKCKFIGPTAMLPIEKKEPLVKKNIRNILYHEKLISLGTKIVTTLTRYGDVPPQITVHKSAGYATMPDTPETGKYGDVRDQRIWQVVLLNGNPTIVMADNPRLSSREAKDLLLKKILGENNG